MLGSKIGQEREPWRRHAWRNPLAEPAQRSNSQGDVQRFSVWLRPCGCPRCARPFSVTATGGVSGEARAVTGAQRGAPRQK